MVGYSERNWLTGTGTVEERVLDISTRKRLGNLNEFESRSGLAVNVSSLGVQLDQSETRGLQQNVGGLLERRGVGEVVETGELWRCLFGNSDQTMARAQAVKEVQRDERASAAEARR